jgi:aminoglycoside 2'-N-acetyltransferase I
VSALGDRHSEISPDQLRLRRLATQEVTSAELSAIREMMVIAFGTEEEERFGEDDWQHALGGTHFLLDLDGELVSHASVVERELHVADRPLRTGYVEAVATMPERQGLGLGSLVMTDVGVHIRERFELGALGTGRHAFYERLGWRTWAGPSAVRTDRGTRRTPHEDGFILVLLTPTTPELDFGAQLSCDWRPGDVW